MWNRSPVQVGCMRQVLRAGALGWPRGMGWRGRREGGSGWGTYVHPWLIQVNVWQKPLQYCKVISLQLVKINEKKKRESISFYASSSTSTFSQGHSGIERRWWDCGELKCSHPFTAELHQPTPRVCFPFQRTEPLSGSIFPSSLCIKAGHVAGTHQWKGAENTTFRPRRLRNGMLLHFLFPVLQAEIEDSQVLGDGGDTERKEPQLLNYLLWACYTWEINFS